MLIPYNRAVTISEQPNLDWKIKKNGEITCQILEVDIYGGETEYDCQIYKQL